MTDAAFILQTLSLDLPLTMDSIIGVITRYPHLKKLQLYLYSEATVCEVMAALAGKAHGSGIPCPRLAEPKLKFGRACRDLHGLEWWTDQAAQIVEERRGLTTIPHVYGPWDRGDTCILLARE